MAKIDEKPSQSTSLKQNWLTGVIPEHLKALEYPIELARYILGISEWTENETKQAAEVLGEALKSLANMHLGQWIEDQKFPGGERISLQTPRSESEIDQALYKISADLKIVGRSLRRMLQHPAFVGRIKARSDAELFAVLVLREAVAENELSTWRYATGMLDLLFMGFLQMEEDNARFEETGRKIREGLNKGREISATVRKKQRYETDKMYRELGIALMQENPGWTLKDVAKEIRAQTGEKHAVGTIKNAIKGIKTSIHSPRTGND